jgi:MerR family transcriptional regulator, light-induced transcriptional regulator
VYLPAVDESPPTLPPVDPGTARLDPGAFSPEMLASLLVEGDDELAAWALRQAMTDAPRAAVFDGLLAGAMALVGRRWESGQWSVAEEHRASLTVLRALERIRPATGPSTRIGPLAVLGSVAGERHMIGLVCLAQVLEEDGWSIADLGADLPASDLATFVARNDASLVALSASLTVPLESVIASIEAVRAARPSLPIILGGAAATRPGIASTLGITWAGTSIAEARQVAGSIESGGDGG